MYVLRLNRLSVPLQFAGLEELLDELEQDCLDNVTTPVVFCHNDLQAGTGVGFGGSWIRELRSREPHDPHLLYFANLKHV